MRHVGCRARGPPSQGRADRRRQGDVALVDDLLAMIGRDLEPGEGLLAAAPVVVAAGPDRGYNRRRTQDRRSGLAGVWHRRLSEASARTPGAAGRGGVCCRGFDRPSAWSASGIARAGRWPWPAVTPTTRTSSWRSSWPLPARTSALGRGSSGQVSVEPSGAWMVWASGSGGFRAQSAKRWPILETDSPAVWNIDLNRLV